jgi:outer membrane protein OmpA-like peptidoglycan-associated protein
MWGRSPWINLLPILSIFNYYQHLLNCEGAGSGGYMKTSRMFKRFSRHTGVLALAVISILYGCATRDYVGKQVDPLSGRVSQTETRIGQAEGQIGQLGERVTISEGKISNLDNGLAEVNEKAGQALASFGNLRLERSLVIDMKEGANFGFNSAILSDEAKQEIDEFLGNLKGDLSGGQNAVFLVAGHTDGTGSVDFNYELGRRRADSVSRYLITQQKIDPLRVVTASYGEGLPIAGNETSDGRAKNRRVEILVYREDINSNIEARQK